MERFDKIKLNLTSEYSNFEVGEFIGDYAIVSDFENKVCFYINKNFEKVSDEYDIAQPFVGDYALVVKTEHGCNDIDYSYFIDKNFKQVSEKYVGRRGATPFSEGYAVVDGGEKHHYHNIYVDKKFKKVKGSGEYFMATSFSEGYASFNIDDKYFYINSNFEVVSKGYDYADPFSGGYASVNDGGSWYFIDKSFTRVSSVYRHIEPFDGDYAYVETKESCFFINKDFEVASKKYKGAFPFGGEYALVSEGGKEHFINRKFEDVSPEYDDGRSFIGGYAFVFTKEDGWFIVDKQFKKLASGISYMSNFLGLPLAKTENDGEFVVSNETDMREVLYALNKKSQTNVEKTKIFQEKYIDDEKDLPRDIAKANIDSYYSCFDLGESFVVVEEKDYNEYIKRIEEVQLMIQRKENEKSLSDNIQKAAEIYSTLKLAK